MSSPTRSAASLLPQLLLLIGVAGGGGVVASAYVSSRRTADDDVHAADRRRAWVAIAAARDGAAAIAWLARTGCAGAAAPRRAHLLAQRRPRRRADCGPRLAAADHDTVLHDVARTFSRADGRCASKDQAQLLHDHLEHERRAGRDRSPAAHPADQRRRPRAAGLPPQSDWGASSSGRWSRSRACSRR